jgi:translation initiation factor 1
MEVMVDIGGKTFSPRLPMPSTVDLVEQVTDDERRPFHNPFGALAGIRDRLPAQPAAPEPPQRAESARVSKTIPRAVVRLERAGRGGKEVTVVEHLAIPPADRERWLKALKTALGCGGVVEGDALVLQGDQRKRLPKLLESRGVKKVTVG